MPEQISRRETLRRGLAAASLLALVPEWAVPGLAQGETDIPFTDYPPNYKTNGNPAAANRFLDIRKIDGFTTPNDQFFFIQHYNRPEVDGNAWRLKLTGLVNKPTELSLADIKGMKSTELVNGYECSGNSARAFEGLSSCGRFTGVPLSHVLKQVGVGSKRPRGGVLRHGPRQGRHRVPQTDVQARTAVCPQHHAGKCDETGAAAGL